MITAIVCVLSALAGVLLGHLLGAFREHRRWIADQKKLEYRELLDQLYETVTVVTDNRPNLSQINLEPINVAVNKLARLFEDRIFVATQLRESSAHADWLGMKKMIYYDPQLEAATPKEFRYTTFGLWYREDSLRKKVLKLAEEDIVKFSFFR